MSDTVSTRALNRALLERQLLLRRDDRPLPDAIEQLVALQAQAPNAPYVGLWSRLENFAKADLTALMDTRQAVRASLLRATLQVTTARDYLRLRPALEPALVKTMRGFMGKRAQGLDLAALADEARALLAERPYGYGELGDTLVKGHPDRDASALAYITLRCLLPVVQKPPGGTWGSGSRATYVNADDRLGSAPHGEQRPDALVRRCLAAFGPATAKDVQTWSGLTGLAAVLKRLRPELDVLRTEDGTELFDLPGAPRPDADTPAPVRLLPEWDNLVLSHHDRTRVISDEDRPKVFRPGARVLPTVLVDGFVRGVWSLKRERSVSRLTVEFFTEPTAHDKEATAAEAERLLSFITDEPGHPVTLTLRT
ncbi:winged helix DNA-binding domain-containing protein [Streptomyces sp. CWNU-52B]|uniref:winged helix DNA-binding domain-containing protein n=1 Tax=unclassified Streptomyces TaxID=2593676 RepID=UPI0039C0EB1C